MHVHEFRATQPKKYQQHKTIIHVCNPLRGYRKHGIRYFFFFAVFVSSHSTRIVRSGFYAFYYYVQFKL